MSSNKTIKLLLQRRKNCPEMKAFLFNILETIADNLSAPIEFTPIWKNKSVKLPFVTKDSKHLVGKSGDDSSALIEFTPLWKTRVPHYTL